MECLQYEKIAIGTEKCTPMVLNLIISGMPSIRGIAQEAIQGLDRVLNLIITGMPSIHCILRGYL